MAVLNRQPNGKIKSIPNISALIAVMNFLRAIDNKSCDRYQGEHHHIERIDTTRECHQQHLNSPKKLLVVVLELTEKYQNMHTVLTTAVLEPRRFKISMPVYSHRHWGWSEKVNIEVDGQWLNTDVFDYKRLYLYRVLSWTRSTIYDRILPVLSAFLRIVYCSYAVLITDLDYGAVFFLLDWAWRAYHIVLASILSSRNI